MINAERIEYIYIYIPHHEDIFFRTESAMIEVTVESEQNIRIEKHTEKNLCVY